MPVDYNNQKPCREKIIWKKYGNARPGQRFSLDTL
jgi:hypothetical protein